MEASIKNFLGDWTVSEWSHHPGWKYPSLAAKNDKVVIRPDPNDSTRCVLSWSGTRTSSNVGGARSPLQYSDAKKELSADDMEILFNGGAITFKVVTVQLGVIVTFSDDDGTKHIGEGPVGTFTAVADPGAGGPIHRKPFWRRWLHGFRCLIDRLDDSRPEERTAMS